jgi:hypothetical protein
MAQADKCGEHMPGGVDSKHQQPERPAGPRAFAAGVPWGLAGFVLGAALWSALGALSFVGGALPQPVPALEPHGAGCTSLAIDRRHGHTTAGPCRSIALPLREAVASARADLTQP